MCHYCNKNPAVYGPFVDEEGIGWMPNCLDDLCEFRAENDAVRQREAKIKK